MLNLRLIAELSRNERKTRAKLIPAMAAYAHSAIIIKPDEQTHSWPQYVRMARERAYGKK